MPYDITTGFDNNHDTVFSDRPAGLTRNMGRGPAFANLYLHCARTFHPGKDQSSQREIEIGIDAFNAFKHANFSNYVGTKTSPFYGRADSARPARELQFTAKFKF